MIVFDLKCSNDHVFEIWFASSHAYEDQRARNLVACAMCGSTDVAKAVMAPRLNAKGNQKRLATPSGRDAERSETPDKQSTAQSAPGAAAPRQTGPSTEAGSPQGRSAAPGTAPPSEPPSVPITAPTAEPTSADIAQMRALLHNLAQAQAKALSQSTWVGDNFAEQARAMHYGEQDHVPIHGQAEPKEVAALAEEGIAIAPLPFPVIPPKAQN